MVFEPVADALEPSSCAAHTTRSASTPGATASAACRAARRGPRWSTMGLACSRSKVPQDPKNPKQSYGHGSSDESCDPPPPPSPSGCSICSRATCCSSRRCGARKLGNPADADPAHRHVVRLTRVEPGVDELYRRSSSTRPADRGDRVGAGGRAAVPALHLRARRRGLRASMERQRGARQRLPGRPRPAVHEELGTRAGEEPPEPRCLAEGRLLGSRADPCAGSSRLCKEVR